MTDHIDDFGFGWGPMRVTRAATTAKGERFLLVDTDSRKLEIAVSPKGQSVRVWLDGVPLVPFGGVA